MTGRLRNLADQATPGPWKFHDSTDPRGHKGEFRAPNPYNGFMLVGPWTNAADARLIALAPDMARLLSDMAAELRKHSSENEHDYVSHAKADALLARFRELEERAG